MRHLFSLLLAALLLLPALAYAQGEVAEETEAGGPAPMPGFVGYDFSDYGFYIDLPEGGYLSDPQSEGWAEAENTVFFWTPDSDYPVWRIDMMVLNFEHEISETDVQDFLDGMIGEFAATDGAAVLASDQAYDDGVFYWNQIDVQHNSDAQPVYSRSYVTYDFTSIYVASFFSDYAPDETLDNIAAGVFNGFMPSAYVEDTGAGTLSYYSAEHGYSILLPGSGYYETPESEGWAETPEVQAVWYSTADDPVSTITLAVFQQEGEYTRESINEVLDSYVAEMIGDGSAGELLQDKENYVIGDNSWNYLEIVDRTDPELPIHMTLFLTPRGNKLYTLFATHLDPLAQTHQEFMFPVLSSIVLP